MSLRLKGCLVTLGFFAAMIIGGFFLMSFVILHDPHAVVLDARLVWNGGSKQMTRLPWGDFVVYVDGDAGVQVTCRNGKVVEGGYVTGLMAADMSVTERCKITA